MWHAMARLGGRDVFRAVIEPGRSVAVGEHGLGVVGDTEDEAELGEVPVRPGQLERCGIGFTRAELPLAR